MGPGAGWERARGRQPYSGRMRGTLSVGIGPVERRIQPPLGAEPAEPVRDLGALSVAALFLFTWFGFY